MTDPASTSESHSTDDLKALLHEAEQALSSTAGGAGENFDDLRGRVRAALDKGEFSLKQVRDETVRRARQADKLVRENPYYAIGVAATVGAFVGILASRRCSSSD